MAMITKRYVFSETAKRIEDSLKTEGFKFLKSNGRILNKYPEGFDVIILSILDYAPVFQIQMSLRVRINQVEEIVNKFQEYSFASPQFMKFTETIGTSYLVLSGAKENHVEVKSEEELDNAINELIKLIQDKGLAFFEKHRDIKTVNAIKKEQILKENNWISHIITNLMQSLTLMKLCNDPDFEELCEKYKELYRPFVGEEITGREAIVNLISYLKNL